MSNRFLRWASTWIEDNILPGANPDIESYADRARRLTDKMCAEALEAGFTSAEVEEERARLAPQILAAASDGRDFDVNAYHLKSLLAQENEDGD
jgi:hypothetical protein